MATQTTNLHLTKPDGTEKVNIATINNNMDIIDAYAGTTNTKIDPFIPNNSYTGDLNSLSTGQFYCDSSCTNLPVSSAYFFVQSMERSVNNCVQIAYKANEDRCFFRRKREGAWNSWQELASNANALFKDVSHNSSTTKITNLNDIQCGTWGRVQLDASVSPTGALITANYIRVGNTTGFSGIFCFTETGDICAYNNCGNGTYSGWKILSNNFESSIATPPNNTVNSNALFGTYFGSDSVVAGLPTSNTGKYYQLLLDKKVQFALRYSTNGVDRYFVRYYINDQWYPWAEMALNSSVVPESLVLVLGSSNFTMGFYQAHKVGQVCHIAARFTTDAAKGANITMFKIQRPNKNYEGIIPAMGNDNNRHAVMNVYIGSRKITVTGIEFSNNEYWITSLDGFQAGETIYVTGSFLCANA